MSIKGIELQLCSPSNFLLGVDVYTIVDEETQVEFTGVELGILFFSLSILIKR